MNKCLISFGANLPGPFGNPSQTLQSVIEELRVHGFIISKRSRYYSSPAFPDASKPKFLNTCLELKVAHEALDVLDFLKFIEKKMGRRKNSRWESRICDLDLLSFDNLVFPSIKIFYKWYNMPLNRQIIEQPDQLLLPHPRLQDRAFVLKPLMDFAEDWIHPVTYLSVKEMFEALPIVERDAVRVI